LLFVDLAFILNGFAVEKSWSAEKSPWAGFASSQSRNLQRLLLFLLQVQTKARACNWRGKERGQNRSHVRTKILPSSSDNSLHELEYWELGFGNVKNNER